MKKISLWIAGIALLSLSVPTFAKEGPGPCRAVHEKFCKDMPKGKEHRECMKKNFNNFSEDCKNHLKAKKEKYKENKKEQKGNGMRAACREDHQKFCKDIPKGDGRIMKCFKDNEANLSEACKEALANRKQKK